MLLRTRKTPMSARIFFGGMVFCLAGIPAIRSALCAQETEVNVPKFAEDVLLHVVLHEIGRGVIREFDVPILGNEETMVSGGALTSATDGRVKISR